MILFEEVAPGDFYTRIGMIIVGGLIFLQGVRIRCSNPPKFVANYRGWSSPELALPFGGVFVFTLRVGAFRPPVPPLLGLFFMLFGFLSGVIFLVGIFIWFPWFLTPKWYRRARTETSREVQILTLRGYSRAPRENAKSLARSQSPKVVNNALRVLAFSLRFCETSPGDGETLRVSQKRG